MVIGQLWAQPGFNAQFYQAVYFIDNHDNQIAVMAVRAMLLLLRMVDCNDLANVFNVGPNPYGYLEIMSS